MVEDSGIAEISFVIISTLLSFVKRIVCIFQYFLEMLLLKGGISVSCWKKMMLFGIGGSAYMGLELLWRGWSHGSMFLAGGSCFLLLGRLDRSKLPLPAKALAGAAIITSVEYAAGLLFNRNYTVWDYRELPMNVQGQICLPFCLLWLPIGLGAMILHRALDHALDSKKPAR